MDVGVVGERATQVPEKWPVLKVLQVTGMWPCCMQRRRHRKEEVRDLW